MKMIIEKATFKSLITDMGFVKGKGFEGEIWTNGDGQLEQVWIAMDNVGLGRHAGWHRMYDASSDTVNWHHFYHWLIAEHQSIEAEKRSEVAMGDEW
jgi:hypothetical protein